MPVSRLPDLQEDPNLPSSESLDPLSKTAETHSQETIQSPHESLPRYTIRRKGSRYNIFGPYGRIFTTYKSASVTGPRWEELTHSPWPYFSTAYEPGTRLRQLGLVPRLLIEASRRPRFVPDPGARPAVQHAIPELALPTLLALPQPRIDLTEQDRLIRALKKDHRLLFRPEMQDALRREIEYHRTHAAWAQNVLDLLATYQARKTGQVRRGVRADEPPIPNILDIYRNPLLALHPDRDGLRAMLRDEARTSGLLAEFALKLEMVLMQWQSQPDRLRWHLHQQAEIVQRGGAARLDHLLGGPQRYRNWRVQQNRRRNARRARHIDASAIMARHIAWQEEASQDSVAAPVS